MAGRCNVPGAVFLEGHSDKRGSSQDNTIGIGYHQRESSGLGERKSSVRRKCSRKEEDKRG